MRLVFVLTLWTSGMKYRNQEYKLEINLCSIPVYYFFYNAPGTLSGERMRMCMW